MRKKYLSALLFGALLFASAGTFTSCKDYDDDIKDLQGQIDQVVKDLESLKTTVESLGGVTDVKIEGNKLVVTSGDKTVSYDLPAGTAPEVEKTKVEIKGQDLVVDGEVIGQVGDKVTVNAEGYLCVNGKATEIKAGKYAILDNESEGTVTITLPDANGELKTITLAKAASGSFKVDCYNSFITVNGTPTPAWYSFFTEINPKVVNLTNVTQESVSVAAQQQNGIAWGVATADVAWDGPKGAVKAGQLLVGQINEVEVRVSPLNFDLSTQTLKLVSLNGETAPVKVTPVGKIPAGDFVTGSRASSYNGLWKLNITMDNTITANNIGTAFATRFDVTDDGDHDKWSNRLYALQANGNIISDYKFIIDTDEKACKMDNADALLDKDKKGNGIVKLDGNVAERIVSNVSLLREHKLTYEQASVYDYKFEIANKDVNDALAKEITLKDNVLKASNKAANSSITLNVKLIGVNGTVKTIDDAVKIEFGAISSDVITLPTSTYKVTPTEYANSTDKKPATVVLDMGDLFSGLSAEEAIAVSKGETVLSTTDETFAFLRQTIVNNNGTGAENINFYKADGTTEVKFDDSLANIREIKIAKVTYENETNNFWNPKATLGEHMLKLTLKDANDNEIRKANVPVNVTIPTFFELFTKSGAWTNNTALAVVDESGNVDLKQLYKDNTKVENAGFYSESTFMTPDNKKASEISSGETATEIVLTKDVVTNTNTLKDVNTELIYKIVPECPNFWVSSDKFTMDVVTKLDKATFVYYGEGGKPAEINVQPESANTINAYTNKNGVKSGLSFFKAGKDHVFTANEDVNGHKLTVKDNYEYLFDAKAGGKATAEFASGALIIKGLAKGNYTTVLTVKYNYGSINSTKVCETFTIKLNVKSVE